MIEGRDEHTLIVRRFIRATPDRLFEAWTTPSMLLSWWGPRGVRCTLAEIDLRVGGRYRLGNEVSEGQVVMISGEFLVVEPPTTLIYTWSIDARAGMPERVTVRFEARDDGTEVVVEHERIPDIKAKEGHAAGWEGCLDGLAAHVSA